MIDIIDALRPTGFPRRRSAPGVMPASANVDRGDRWAVGSDGWHSLTCLEDYGARTVFGCDRLDSTATHANTLLTDEILRRVLGAHQSGVERLFVWHDRTSIRGLAKWYADSTRALLGNVAFPGVQQLAQALGGDVRIDASAGDDRDPGWVTIGGSFTSNEGAFRIVFGRTPSAIESLRAVATLLLSAGYLIHPDRWARLTAARQVVDRRELKLNNPTAWLAVELEATEFAQEAGAQLGWK